MTIAIDKVRTGQQIRLLMEKRGVTVRDVKNALSLACVQSVYHWLDGQSMPTLDNLYALSDLLKVPMDMLVCGNRRYEYSGRCGAPLPVLQAHTGMHGSLNQ